MSIRKPTSAGRVGSAQATMHARARRHADQRSSGIIEALERRALLSAVTGFSLVNADTDQVISPLAPGQVIDLATIGTTHLNVAANTDGDVASVRFAHNGNPSLCIDNIGVFTAAVDTSINGDFGPWGITPGPQTLVAIPFATPDATGPAGSALGVVFYVIDSTPPAPADDGGIIAPPIDTTPNTPPAVHIVSPEAGKRAAPGFYVVRADATDTDGSVAKVEYFANNTLIGTASAAPFLVSWTNVPSGTYALTAVAYDDRGAATASAAVSVTLVDPTGGHTYYVSADTGNDENSGSADHPFKTIDEGAHAAGPGDTVLIAPGTYKEAIDLRGGGTTTAPLTFAAQTPGTVVIDGRDSSGKVRQATLLKPLYPGRADNVVLSGLTFRYAKNDPGNHFAAVQTGNGWLVEDCTFQKVDGNGLGILGNDVTVLRCVAEDNGSAGLGGSGFSNVLVQDTISRRNNTEFKGGTEGGGGKWTRANGLLIERYNGYDNDGPGLWLDIENINVTIRDSALHHNYSVYRKDGSSKIDGIGMFFEISGVVADNNGKVIEEGPILAEDNLVYDNERQGVLVYASQNVTLRNNVFANNDVTFKDQRPMPYENRDDQILNNRFQNARITADDYTAANGWKKKHFVFDANVFDNLDGRVYRWGNNSYNSMSQLRTSLGFELTGARGTVTYDPVIVDDPSDAGAA